MIKTWKCSQCGKKRRLLCAYEWKGEVVSCTYKVSYYEGNVQYDYHFCNLVCMEKWIIERGTKEVFDETD